MNHTNQKKTKSKDAAQNFIHIAHKPHSSTLGLISPLLCGLTYLHTPEMIWHCPWRRPWHGSPVTGSHRHVSGFCGVAPTVNPALKTAARTAQDVPCGDAQTPSSILNDDAFSHHFFSPPPPPPANTDFQMQNTSATRGETDWFFSPGSEEAFLTASGHAARLPGYSLSFTRILIKGQFRYFFFKN